MKAAVLKSIGSVVVEDCREPRIENSHDAIVHVTTAAICGSDLHIVEGRDRGIRMGTIMGHEFVGIVEEKGKDVLSIQIGDRVLSPFSINCGRCFFCLRGLTARCIHALPFGFVHENGLGLEGSQAEYVRVPLADTTLVPIPPQLADEDVLFLGDVFATAYSTAEHAQIKKDDVVTIIGCGPVGLLCILAAKLFEPSAIVAVDSIDYRLEKARSFGAIAVMPDLPAIREVVWSLTDERGADACLEAVGNPSALDLAIAVARPGAVISVAGYHTESSYAMPIHECYSKNLTIRIGRCSAREYIDLLLPLVVDRKIPLRDIVTHVLPLKEAPRGYEIFAKRLENAIKVLLSP